MRMLSIETPTHGRVLLREAVASPVRGTLIAFHGYGQAPEAILGDLEGVAGLEAWTVAGVQALHRFYTRGDQAVVASWMTRQDRDEAIADNLTYVDRVVAAVADPTRPLVFVGFSQGVAMAYRAAVRGGRPAAGVVALAGDIPPDVELHAAPPVLLGAGVKDSWYSPDRLRADVARLEAAAVTHEVVSFAGGHEWTNVFSDALARWLARR
jgi:predicted esterase